MLDGYEIIDYKTEFVEELGNKKLNHIIKAKKNNDIVEVRFTTLAENIKIQKEIEKTNIGGFDIIKNVNYILNQNLIADSNSSVYTITQLQKEMTLDEIEKKLKYKVVLKGE